MVFSPQRSECKFFVNDGSHYGPWLDGYLSNSCFAPVCGVCRYYFIHYVEMLWFSWDFGHLKYCCNSPMMRIRLFHHRCMCPWTGDGMTEGGHPDRTAPQRAVWSGSALFVYSCLSGNLGTLRQTLFGCIQSKIMSYIRFFWTCTRFLHMYCTFWCSSLVFMYFHILCMLHFHTLG